MTATLYVRHQSGATHRISGRRAERLRREIAAGRGCAEATELVELGYEGYLGPDGQVWCFEELKADHFA